MIDCINSKSRFKLSLYCVLQVMSKGQMSEFDRPSQLLQLPNSLFRGMVDKTGSITSQRLCEIAQEADLRKRHLKETTV